MSKVGFVRHPLYLEHVIDDYHPESPQRLQSIYAMIDSDWNDRLVMVEPREATHEQLGWVHAPSYIKLVADTEGRFVRLDPDTAACPHSYRAALMAAGGTLAAVDSVFNSEVKRVFAAVRPPGHHAEATRSAGFCLFNNIAIAAEYAMRNYDCERILIYDWDLHHGNGTQHTFEGTGRVFYISTHQYPYYPGTGAFYETGRGAGEGFTLNMPLSTGYGTGDFLWFIERIIKPVAMAYKPDLVLISAGYDTYEGDPLGGMQVSPEGYGAMTHHMLEIADKCCNGRIVMVLEGGYHIQGLTKSVRRTLQVMESGKAEESWLDAEMLNPHGAHQVLGSVLAAHQDFWPVLLQKD